MCSLHNTPTIQFQRLHEAAVLPTKAHPSDACFDLVATGMRIQAGYVTYKLGFATAIPEGWQALVYPRSSVSGQDLVLCNGVAVIDAGYRGEWEVRFKIIPRTIDGYHGPLGIMESKPTLYERGDKVAQVQFQRVPMVDFHEVSELPASTRGAGGFGSTGR